MQSLRERHRHVFPGVVCVTGTDINGYTVGEACTPIRTRFGVRGYWRNSPLLMQCHLAYFDHAAVLG